jgi:hypothetical protein
MEDSSWRETDHIHRLACSVVTWKAKVVAAETTFAHIPWRPGIQNAREHFGSINYPIVMHIRGGAVRNPSLSEQVRSGYRAAPRATMQERDRIHNDIAG